LKEFLKIRENSPKHEIYKRNGGIGIPTLLVDGEIYIDPSREELLNIFRNK